MVTNRVIISNNGTGIDKALDLTEQTAQSIGLAHKDTSRLRLLAEEMFSMVRAITKDFNAEFWLEENNCDCKLHLEAKSTLDYSKRKELLSVSTQGKNIARRGIMEKIREIIETGLGSVTDSISLQNEYGVGMFTYGALGISDIGMSEAIYAWSMQKYKSEIESEKSQEPEAWDELEKSIIANVADEVQVGICNDRIELIVQKNFNGSK